MTRGDASIADLRARLVEEPNDLAGLREILASASGRVVSAQRGVGDEVLLRIRSDDGIDGGDWRVGTQASDWVLASPSSVLAGAHASAEAVDSALAELDDAGVTRLEVTAALSLVVVLSDGRWLEVAGDVDDPDERDGDPPYWEVFAPTDELLSAGPGPIWVRAASRIRPTARAPRLALDQLAIEELFGLWGTVTAELRRRGVVQRPETVVGDIAEELVRKHFGGFRGSYDRAGWDVLSDAGERIEVKTVRCRAGSKRLPNLSIRDGEFDALVVVLFDDELAVRKAWHVPREVVMRLAAPGANRNGLRSLPLRRVLEDRSVSSIELA